ncbi:tigger transposable element-derived protein 1-like [Onthophagus taurus]|uniref:tigger transposable element-derived protein 1-like n=1 Tax=Onthophagus taurus TaxID=166361 RepID=UPI0039BDE1CA
MNKRKGDREIEQGSKRRKPITFAEKLKIIEMAEKGEKLAEIGRRLGYSRSTVNTIVKSKECLKCYVKDGVNLQQTSGTRIRSNVMEEIEGTLKVWLDSQLHRNIPLSLSAIQQKAKEIYSELRKKMDENATDTFNASWGWFRRFKIRANLIKVKLIGEAASTDSNAASEFIATLKAIVHDGNYSPHQIFNVDETGLFWKNMPSNTYITKDEKRMPGYKAAKDRLTLLLSGNAAGDFKLKPILVYHSENPRALKGVSKSSMPVIWKSNRKAWVTKSVFEDWYRNNFIPEVKDFCSKNNLVFKALPLLDNAPGHPITLNELCPNIKVIFLPSNTTSLIQPMDQTVIGAFKKYYLRATMVSMIKAIDDNKELTVKSYWKDYNIHNGIKNISASWDEVKETTMKRAWKKLCPQFVYDEETNVENLQNEVVEGVIEIGTRLGLEINEEDIEELTESHDEELSIEDLMELQKTDNVETNDDDAVEDLPKENVLNVETLSEILNKMENLADVIENVDPNMERNSNVVGMLRDAFTCYKTMYIEKKKTGLRQFTLKQFLTKKT